MHSTALHQEATGMAVLTVDKIIILTLKGSASEWRIPLMDFPQQDSTSCQMLQRASLPPGWRKTYHPTSTSRHFGSRPERSTHTLVRVLDCLEKQSSNQTSHYTITTLITADKIDRTIECLIQLGVRPGTLPRQPLRLTGGVAQGTLLGPLIFPAVIDSTAWDVDSRWKYVDNLDRSYQ